MKPLVIAAPSSGCGKTTVALALMAACRRRGLAVAPFKVGPDFIDPGHHEAVCGRSSRNLDGWMCGEAGVRETFARGATGADLAVVEGVMGLFDGAGGASDEGSTAEVSRWLGGRILLVLDVRSQARSAAALAQGFARFDPRLEFAGVLLNRVGSDRHREILREAFAAVPGLPPVLGALPRAGEITLPERHLGLVTAGETDTSDALYERWGQWFESHVDMEGLLAVAVNGGRPGSEKVVTIQDLTPRVRVAVARDEAFCFCYPENLERLEAAGAELVFFSPLREDRLPKADGAYLPGGYPELYGERLSRNVSLLRDLREAALAGLPIYAECGGLMLLCRSMEGHLMAGVLPASVRMLSRRQALGYREVVTTAPTLLGPEGTIVRGHEFHYSALEGEPDVPRSYLLRRRAGEVLGTEGYRIGNTLASYIHLHFGSNPRVPENIVGFCRSRRQPNP